MLEANGSGMYRILHNGTFVHNIMRVLHSS